MTYLVSCSALRCYFSCVQVLNELPDIIVVDGFFELRGAELDAELGSQWLSTMAAAADAAAYLKHRCVGNPICFALQRCPRLPPVALSALCLNSLIRFRMPPATYCPFFRKIVWASHYIRSA